MDNLKQPLKSLGFTSKEVEIYVSLLELESASYTQLAKESGIKRTSLYTIIQRMQERGMVQYSIDGRRLIATPPETLFSQLQANALQFHKFIPQLKALGKNKRVISRVKFYSGAEVIKQAYKEGEAKLPAKKDRIARVVSDGDTWDAFWNTADPEFTENYLKEMKAKSYHWKVMISGNPNDAFSKEKSELYNFEVKILPSEYKNEFDMEIHDSYIILADLKNEQPYAIKIVSTELAHALTNFFEFAWNLYANTMLDQPSVPTSSKLVE